MPLRTSVASVASAPSDRDEATTDVVSSVDGRVDGRIAGAPASWGICEVDGWGHQLAADVVLGQMREIGLRCTELGPEGFLAATPPELRARLERHGMTALGAFCPLVLHRRFSDLRPVVDSALDVFEAVGARVMVISASPGNESERGYDARQRLTDDEWKVLVQNLERVVDIAAERGVQACLHPHVGTMVESRSEVYRLVDDSDVTFCLDSGHLLVGGTDPVRFARAVPERVAHVHIKDVDTSVLSTVRSGARSYTEGVRAGMYTVLGQGCVDVSALVAALEGAGYRGWYVPEHDRMLGSAADAADTLADTRASTEFLSRVIAGGHDNPGSRR